MKLAKSFGKIVVSQTRAKLLRQLFYLPNESYYVRQLVRLTGEGLNSVRRELANLESAEIVKSEWRGNRLFYWVNQHHPLFQELLSIVLKVEGLGAAIINNRQRLGQIKFVVFSGRFARNLPHGPEEVDLLVVGKVVLPELGVLVREEEKRREREINYTVMTESEFRFRKRNRDPFINQILLRSRVMIIGDEQQLVDF